MTIQQIGFQTGLSDEELLEEKSDIELINANIYERALTQAKAQYQNYTSEQLSDIYYLEYAEFLSYMARSTK